MLFEKRVVRKARAGDKDAMHQLYNAYFENLWRFIRHKVESKEVCEDICAESFMKAFENISKFESKSSFKSWLFTIAHHKLVDHYAEKSKMSAVEIEDQTAVELARNEGTAEKEVKDVLDKLSEEYRQILELRFIAGFNVRETAEELNITPGNAKVLQHRAIKKAREILNLGQ